MTMMIVPTILVVAVATIAAAAFAPVPGVPHQRRPSAEVVVAPLSMSTLAPTSPRLREATPPEDDGDEQQQQQQKRDDNRRPRRDPGRAPVRPGSESAPTVPRGAISSTLAELAETLGGRGRAQLAWDCYSIGVDPALFYSPIIQLGHDDFETILEELPSQRRRLRLGTDTLHRLASTYHRNGGGGGEGATGGANAVAALEGGVASLSHVSVSADSTTKLLLKLRDGLEVETVIIPWKGVRSTLCISSQVGCRQGCTFCATGRMGKLRSLTSDEILAQHFFAKKLCRLNRLPPISNVVFMGMGEAADNAEAVLRACDILTSRELFQLSASKVTVSTVGPSPEAFAILGAAPCVLAWSVHAVNDALRRQLVPTTRHSMNDLQRGFIEALLQRPHNFRAAMLEVVLLDGVNDSLVQAEELAHFAREISDAVPGSKLMVNLIPYNDIGDLGGSDGNNTTGGGGSVGRRRYRKPSPDSVEAFQRNLRSRGVYAHVRATRGDDESAACGQLATASRQKQRLQLQEQEQPPAQP